MKKSIIPITIMLILLNNAKATCAYEYMSKSSQRYDARQVGSILLGIGALGLGITTANPGLIIAAKGMSATALGNSIHTAAAPNKFDKISTILLDEEENSVLKKIYNKSAKRLLVINNETHKEKVLEIINEADQTNQFCSDRLYRPNDIIDYVVNYYN